MKFALYLNPQTGGAEFDAQIIRSITKDALRADEAGFNGIWLTDHHFNDYNTYGDPFVFGASLAPQLKNAWIVLTVATLALRNPIRFAEQANMLDLLMDGRFIAGYGTGGSGVEFAGFNRSVEERYELMMQVLKIAEKAWALTPEDEPLEYETKFDSGIVRGRIMPASARSPHPLLGRGTLSNEGIAQTAELGHILFMGRLRPEQAGEQVRFYEQELRKAGHAEDHIQLCLDRAGPVRMMFLAPTDEQAHDEVQEVIDGYLDYVKRASAADRREREVVGKRPVFQEREDLLDRAVIWGGPEKVASELAAFQQEGLRQFTTWFNWGGISAEKAERSLELFIAEVMPRLEAVRGDKTLRSAGGM